MKSGETKTRMKEIGKAAARKGLRLLDLTMTQNNHYRARVADKDGNEFVTIVSYTPGDVRANNNAFSLRTLGKKLERA